MDELSLVMAPVVADAEDKCLFHESSRSDYVLAKATPMDEGVMWLQYKRKL